MTSLVPRCVLMLGALVCGGAAALHADAFPQGLSSSQVQDAPYRYNGLIEIQGGGRASGWVAHERVVATAAHVVFDAGNLRWEPPARLRFALRYHSTRSPGSSDTITPLGSVRWDTYRLRELDEAGTVPSESSTAETFNLDFATLYFSQDVDGGRYAPSRVTEETRVSALRETRRQQIVGYPADPGLIGNNVGRMHAHGPQTFDVFRRGDLFFNPDDSAFDPGGFWWSLFSYDAVASAGGNSGGPVFIENDFGVWEASGTLVGGSPGFGPFAPTALIRGLDDAAWLLVEEAAEASGAQPGLRRVAPVLVESLPGRARITWQDRSTGESAYRLYRRDVDAWALLAELPADTEAYEDRTTEPGIAHAYAVTPVDALGNRMPLSHPRAPADPAETSRTLAEALEAPFLALRSSGDRTFRPSTRISEDPRLSEGVESGELLTEGTSTLELRIDGPGVLSFTQAVSSEENPNFNNPSFPEFRQVYDALFTEVNGAEQFWISGEVSPQTRTLSLPAGPNTVTWTYRKDPYTGEGFDAAYLSDLVWQRGTASHVFGAYTVEADLRAATWWGRFIEDPTGWHWRDTFGWYRPEAQSEYKGFWAQLMHPEWDFAWIAPEAYPLVWVPGIGWVQHLPEHAPARLEPVSPLPQWTLRNHRWQAE